MNDLSILAEHLKDLRIENNLTQRGLAQAIGTTAASISAYETGLKHPSLPLATKIAEYFNVSLDWLCGVSSNKSNDGIATYADMINKFIIISKYIKCRPNAMPQYYDGTCAIEFSDYTIKQFIEEWSKMKTLYDDNTIDDYLYFLWIDKQLDQYSNLFINGSLSS